MNSNSTKFPGVGRSTGGVETLYEDKVTHEPKHENASNPRQMIHAPKEAPVAGRDIADISYTGRTTDDNAGSTDSSEPAEDPRADEGSSSPAIQEITFPVRSPVAGRDIGNITYC
ncbi:uncharacterized protein BDV14DRAFT_175447, partial [Aspergillus stella-maris]|uniref:uncharacterized protein n=1 Tax=Aspergillus stella-maris TaxID=1810926 RepID=UPI003CCDF5AE